jgi:hypothetical protein
MILSSTSVASTISGSEADTLFEIAKEAGTPIPKNAAFLKKLLLSAFLFFITKD